MAITQAMTTSFKVELLEAVHNFTTGTGDTFKLALFRAQGLIVGTFGAGTVNYSDMGVDEVSGTNYVAGGLALTTVTPASSGPTALLTFSNAVFANVTLIASGALVYNSSKANKAACLLNFGADKIYTAQTMTIIFPTADAANAVIRLV